MASDRRHRDLTAQLRYHERQAGVERDLAGCPVWPHEARLTAAREAQRHERQAARLRRKLQARAVLAPHDATMRRLAEED